MNLENSTCLYGKRHSLFGLLGLYHLALVHLFGLALTNCLSLFFLGSSTLSIRGRRTRIESNPSNLLSQLNRHMCSGRINKLHEPRDRTQHLKKHARIMPHSPIEYVVDSGYLVRRQTGCLVPLFREHVHLTRNSGALHSLCWGKLLLS